MKIRIIFILIIFLVFLQNINAQNNKKDNLSYDEFCNLNDSLGESLGIYLMYWSNTYYSSYLEFTTDVNKFFTFEEEDKLIIPEKIQFIFSSFALTFKS
ncbi:hypothetical protein LJC11_04120 [Bacteroidales bacterium OttesenSCG-928-I21]|nr:hypothetical protein [Bacteroidales bacterium OttesenSCG-928-I21]